MSEALSTRRVEAETLDHLPEDDPRAVRSRRDLRRINRILGNFLIVDSLLNECLARPPLRIAELGAGDGSLLMDVFAWLERGDHPRYDAIVANLFVHHFEFDSVARLFRAIAQVTDCFVACEPRRARIALLGSHLVGAVGANAVTRRDSVLSVRAGFRDRELSACWPSNGEWQTSETDARLFSHTFAAVRRAQT
jgi:hypothetical protein